jgi:hypothetical protein
VDVDTVEEERERYLNLLESCDLSDTAKKEFRACLDALAFSTYCLPSQPWVTSSPFIDVVCVEGQSIALHCQRLPRRCLTVDSTGRVVAPESARTWAWKVTTINHRRLLDNLGRAQRGNGAARARIIPGHSRRSCRVGAAATRLAAISSLFQRGNPSLSSSKHRFQASIFHLHTVRRLQAKKASSEHVRTYPRSSIRAIQRIAAVSRPAHAEPLPQRAHDAISPHL